MLGRKTTIGRPQTYCGFSPDHCNLFVGGWSCLRFVKDTTSVNSNKMNRNKTRSAWVLQPHVKMKCCPHHWFSNLATHSKHLESFKKYCCLGHDCIGQGLSARIFKSIPDDSNMQKSWTATGLSHWFGSALGLGHVTCRFP